MTETKKLAVFEIIEARVAELIHESNEASWSISDKFAGVQPLILIYTIQLFDGDIRQRALAEQNEAILVRWTDQLHMRTKDELVASNPLVWPSWIFAESLHGTILLSHLLRGLYSCFKLGFCNNDGSLAPLFFTAQAPQWDSAVGVSYYDIDAMSDKTRPVQAEAFERLLLVACKGGEYIGILGPDLLFQEVYR